MAKLAINELGCKYFSYDEEYDTLLTKESADFNVKGRIQLVEYSAEIHSSLRQLERLAKSYNIVDEGHIRYIEFETNCNISVLPNGISIEITGTHDNIFLTKNFITKLGYGEEITFLGNKFNVNTGETSTFEVKFEDCIF